MVAPERKSKAAKRPRTRRSRQLLDDDDDDEEKEKEVKIIKKEVTSLLVSLSPVSFCWGLAPGGGMWTLMASSSSGG